MGLEFTHHQESNCSLVAKGAALAAIDPDLGLREFARTTYGTILTVPYNAKKPTHVADKHLREETPAWTRHGYELHDRFIPMLKKGQRVNGSYVMDEIIEGEATPGQPFPRVLKHHIYQVDDEEWGQREDWNVMETPANVKFVTTLKVQVPQERCEFQTYKVHGVKYYRIWFRAKLVWDGLCEKWLFYVHPTGKQIRTAQDEQECFSADPLVLDDVLARQDMENYDDDDDDDHYQARDGLDRIAQAVNGIKSEEDNDLVTGDAMNGVTHQ